ncbi:hypothetical protein P5673_032500 [Acropora cervicornis]|uniref:Uncharacterized protein n=1 Tax=Acropora cervicornis TaxID=6130 RepID=A0AAD9PR56_ACRCE|nr:hypothetical protein P5673_032500 [Acropora cervicornis]
MSPVQESQNISQDWISKDQDVVSLVLLSSKVLYRKFNYGFLHDELPLAVIFHAMSTNLSAVVCWWWKSANA